MVGHLVPVKWTNHFVLSIEVVLFLRIFCTAVYRKVSSFVGRSVLYR